MLYIEYGSGLGAEQFRRGGFHEAETNYYNVIKMSKMGRVKDANVEPTLLKKLLNLAFCYYWLQEYVQCERYSSEVVALGVMSKRGWQKLTEMYIIMDKKERGRQPSMLLPSSVHYLGLLMVKY